MITDYDNHESFDIIFKRSYLSSWLASLQRKYPSTLNLSMAWTTCVHIFSSCKDVVSLTSNERKETALSPVSTVNRNTDNTGSQYNHDNQRVWPARLTSAYDHCYLKQPVMPSLFFTLSKNINLIPDSTIHGDHPQSVFFKYCGRETGIY